jgi:hypothetical protein
LRAATAGLTSKTLNLTVVVVERFAICALD